jgi:hypothetical protein
VAKAVVKPAGKPATTIVKAGGAKVAATPVRAVGATAAAPAPVVYQEEASTTVTTALAGALAFLTWGTAIYLFASLNGWI